MAEDPLAGPGDAEIDEPAPSRRSPLFRVVAIVVLISFVLAWVPGLLNLLQAFVLSR